MQHSPLDAGGAGTPPTPAGATPAAAFNQELALEMTGALATPPHVVPSQRADDAPVLLHHPHQQHQHHAPYSAHRGSAFAPPALSPLLFGDGAQPLPPTSSTSGGVVRPPSGRATRAVSAHPYIRPGVPAFMHGSSSATPTPPAPSRGGKRAASVRFATPPAGTSTGMVPRPQDHQPALASPAAAGPSRLPFSSAVPRCVRRLFLTFLVSSMLCVECDRALLTQSIFCRSPATHSPPGQSPLARGSPSVLHDRSPLTQAPHTLFPPAPQSQYSTMPPPPARPQAQTQPRRQQRQPPPPSQHPQPEPLRTLRADMHYSPRTRTLHASLEVPGVRRAALRVSLGTCFFNRVKYVCVAARSAPVFPPPGAPEEEEEATPVEGEQAVREEEEEDGEGDADEGGPTAGASATDAPIAASTKQEEAEEPPAPGIPTYARRGASPTLRERRFGSARRVIQVPATTTVRRVPPCLFPARSPIASDVVVHVFLCIFVFILCPARAARAEVLIACCPFFFFYLRANAIQCCPYTVNRRATLNFSTSSPSTSMPTSTSTSTISISTSTSMPTSMST